MTESLFDQQQTLISRKIESAREAYPALWRSLINEWQSAENDALWLTYSANYLLYTAGIRWALDPYSLFTRLKEKTPINYSTDLTSLQLIVLSHAHADHLDMNILAALSQLPVTWVVPEFMLDKVKKSVDIPSERLIVPQPGIPILLGGLRLIPFEALHIHGKHGVPEMGYLAEFSGKRWLFPGDTRVYSLEGLPHFENLDGVFAHLWLGKSCALEKQPPFLESFCQFFVKLRPEKIVVTHLEELGRDAYDFWDLHHYRQVQEMFQEMDSAIRVLPAMMGQRVGL